MLVSITKAEHGLLLQAAGVAMSAIHARRYADDGVTPLGRRHTLARMRKHYRNLAACKGGAVVLRISISLQGLRIWAAWLGEYMDSIAVWDGLPLELWERAHAWVGAIRCGC